MNELLDMILSGVGVIGDVLDTPGAMARNALAGRNPFQGFFSPEERTSGRDMLETWGVLGENQDGLDWGDAAGFGAEMLTDPLNFLGTKALTSTARAAKEAKAANAGIDSAKEIINAAGNFHGSYAKPIPPGTLASARRTLSLYGELPTPDRVDRLVLSSQDDAAQEIARLVGLDLVGPSDAARRMYAAAPATGYSFSTPVPEAGFQGAVFPVRADLAFLSNSPDIRDPFAIAGHELVHNMAGMYPKAIKSMQNAMGMDALEAGVGGYTRGFSDDQMRAFMGKGTGIYEEGAADLIERGYRLSRNLGETPILNAIDASLGAKNAAAARKAIEPYARVFGLNAQDAARMSLDARMEDPVGAADIYTQFVAGVPSRDMHGSPVLFGPDLAKRLSRPVTTHEPMMSVLPEYHDVPSLNPLLAAILGYNAASHGGAQL